MDDEALLATIYRGRPSTISDLSTLAHLTPAAADAAVARLRGRGLLGGRDEELAYLHPASWVAETITARSSELRRNTQEMLSDVDRMVADLPALLNHWSVGEASAALVPVLTRHGPHASEDLWFDTARHDSGELLAVLSDLDRFLSTGDERQARFARALAGKDDVRVIVSSTAFDDPVAAERMGRYAAAGVQFRMIDDPPSWFWVDGDQLAVPFEWGEGRTTSVLGLQNSSVAGLARTYFEQLWNGGEPHVPFEDSWTPLLRLMRQGATLETASRMIGVNPRTGRRRIAVAMSHYRVSTLFALGAAWGADPRRAR